MHIEYKDLRAAVASGEVYVGSERRAWGKPLARMGGFPKSGKSQLYAVLSETMSPADKKLIMERQPKNLPPPINNDQREEMLCGLIEAGIQIPLKDSREASLLKDEFRGFLESHKDPAAILAYIGFVPATSANDLDRAMNGAAERIGNARLHGRDGGALEAAWSIEGKRLKDAEYAALRAARTAPLSASIGEASEGKPKNAKK